MPAQSQLPAATRGPAASVRFLACLLAAAVLWPGRPARSQGQGEPLREPVVLNSAGGVLDVTLVLDEGEATIGGQQVGNVWTYRIGEGGAPNYPGPTLHVSAGDTLRIRIVNHLEAEPTSLHTHGVHVTPLGNADNVLLSIPPGGSNQFEFHIPADHPDGLYWYHPHRHGFVDSELYRGLSGLLVIGRPDSGPAELNGVPQRLMALQFSQVTGGTLITPPLPVSGAIQYTINGQVQPRIDIRPGESQVWNVANISNNAFFSLVLKGTDGAADPPVVLVAQDGQPYTTPVLVPPGQRVELSTGQRRSILVQGPPVGTYELRTEGLADGFNTWPARSLATVVSAGPPLPPTPVPPQLTPPHNMFQPLNLFPVDQSRVAVFSDNRVMGVTFLINGAQFPDNPVFQPRLNTVEEWELINVTKDIHPFHIHVNDFQVISLTDPLHPANDITVPQPFYQDIVDIPIAHLAPDGSLVKPGRVVIRMMPEDFLGTYVYHCHRVAHEDLGMMALVKILPETPIFAAGAGAGLRSRVRVFDGLFDQPLAEFDAFPPGFRGGVRVAVGDVNGDGVMDVAAVPGPGGPARVKVLDGASLFHKQLYNLPVADPAFRGGLNVALGDMNSDGFDDMVVAPATNGGWVNVLSGRDGSLLASFPAYPGPARHGVTLACEIIADGGRYSIVTGTGATGPPQIKVFNVDWDMLGAAGPPACPCAGAGCRCPAGACHCSRGPQELLPIVEVASTFAYPAAFRGGVNVGTGAIDGENGGFGSVLAGPGSGGQSLVKTFVLHGAHHGMPHGLEPPQLEEMASFQPYPSGLRSGISVSSVSTSGGAHLLTTPSTGGASILKRFRFVSDLGSFAPVDSFPALNPTLRNGVVVGGR